MINIFNPLRIHPLITLRLVRSSFMQMAALKGFVRLNKPYIWAVTLVIVCNVVPLFWKNPNTIFSITAFLVFIGVPGLLLLSLFRTRVLSLAETVILSFGLGIASLMAEGYLINLILASFNSKPLNDLSIHITVDMMVLVLIAASRFRGNRLQIRHKKYRISTKYIAGVSLLIPFMAVASANRLNNGATGSLTFATLALIIIIWLVAVYKDRFSSIYPLVLFTTGLSLLLLFSLRSNFIASGSDMGLEYHMFQLTYQKAHWFTAGLNGAYSSCLSITILPTMLEHLTKESGAYVFKLLFQLIFALSPVALYVYARKYFGDKVAFVAGIFFITQSIFISWMPILGRQEIAFLFFALLLFVLFDQTLATRAVRAILFIIFGFSMIVSHYSSTYLLIVVSLGIIAEPAISRLYRKKIPPYDKHKLSNSVFVILILFAFLWQAQVTTAVHGFTQFIDSTRNAIINNVSGDQKNPSASKALSFNPFGSNGTDAQAELDTYKKQVASNGIKNDYYNTASEADANTNLSSLPSIYSRSDTLYKISVIVNVVISIVIRLSMLLSVFLLYRIRKRLPQSYFAMTIIFLFLIAAVVLLPFVSMEYNLERLYQQTLYIFAPAIVLLIYSLFNLMSKKGAMIPTFLVIMLFFLYNSGLSAQMFGGQANIILNNSGKMYYDNYTKKMDVTAVEWLNRHYIQHIPVNLSWSSGAIVSAYSSINYTQANLLPGTVKVNSYVYLSSASTQQGVVMQYYKGNVLYYTTPNLFLQANKNRLYDAGGAIIYK